MISETYVSVRITPEIGRKIEARVAGTSGLEPLPHPVRFAGHGKGYRRCDTGEGVTQEIIDWRDARYAGQEPHQRPTPTPRIDAGLEAMLGLHEAPRPRSWYSRSRPVATSDLGEALAEALRLKVRASLGVR